jgi:hypothetical protein
MCLPGSERVILLLDGQRRGHCGCCSLLFRRLLLIFEAIANQSVARNGGDRGIGHQLALIVISSLGLVIFKTYLNLSLIVLLLNTCQPQQLILMLSDQL